ncbi:ABC transporter permease [Candidatus Thorarchaeota archaeon]|nr:MAG: ABC transporter permease [Candidatus Thorarchaeota archaeon]
MNQSKKKRKNNGRKMLWLMKKEVKTIFRSRWLLLGFMLSPLFAWTFQGFFLNFLFAQAVEPEHVYITIENVNGTNPEGQDLYDAIVARYEFEKTQPTNSRFLLFSNLTTVSAEEGLAMWENRTAPVWVYIPQNFTSILNQSSFTFLIMYVNTGSFRASSAAERITIFAQQEVRVTDLYIDRRTPPATEASYGHQLAIFLVMITSVLAPSPYVSKSFAGERERHTLEALLVVPMSRLRILGAKLVAGILLTLFYSIFTVVGISAYNGLVILRAAGSVNTASQISFYSVSTSSIPLIVFCQFLVLLCAIGIGIVISTIARDQATSESVNNLLLLVPTMVIGILGFTGSISQFGGLFGAFVYAIPFSHAIMFLNGVLSPNPNLAALSINVIYMVVFTIVTLIIGAKLFEREAIIA